MNENNQVKQGDGAKFRVTVEANPGISNFDVEAEGLEGTTKSFIGI